MRYTVEDKWEIQRTSENVSCMMDSTLYMRRSMGGGGLDQTTMQCMDTMMVKAYNTLHEYVMYREQRMREAQDETD